jgi:hypothetical protein
MPRKPGKIGDYAVGYGRPPVHTRFKPGSSGNPRGRPKGSLDVATLLDAILSERITVRDGGRTRRLSRAQLMLLTASNKAVKGDIKAMQFLLKERLGTSRDAEGSETHEAAEDAAILESFMARLLASGNGGEA